MDKKMMIDRPMKILKGFLAAWVLIALGIVGAGIVMLLTPAGIKTGSYIIIGAASAGGFLCGSSASSAVGRRGLIVGLISGMILSLTILAAYLLFFGVAADQSLNYLPLGLPAAAGAAGGLFGMAAGSSPAGGNGRV